MAEYIPIQDHSNIIRMAVLLTTFKQRIKQDTGCRKKEDKNLMDALSYLKSVACESA